MAHEVSEKGCCEVEHGGSETFKRVLWVALILNFAMFGVEIYFGLASKSSSLKADSLDFLGDAFNYGISLFVFGFSAVLKARASQLKAVTMVLFGFWIIYDGYLNFISQALPEHKIMTGIGALAFAVNLLVALLLFKFREGDSQMKSVWLCTRNDVIGNILVLAAAGGVAYFNNGIPDLLVALLMAGLAVSAGFTVFRQAKREIALARAGS